MSLFRIPSFEPELEVRYLAERAARVVPFERAAILVAIVGFAGVGAWDAQVDAGALPQTALIRLGEMVVLSGLLAVTYTRWGRYHFAIQSAAFGSIAAAGSWVLAVLPDGFNIGVAGLTVVTVVMPLLALRLAYLLWTAAMMWVVPNLAIGLSGGSTFAFVNLNTWMALSLLAAIALWLVLDRSNRDLFLARLELTAERERADTLLRNILPEEIAERLKRSDKSVSARHDDVTILFADLVGFTAFSRDHEPDLVVNLLNALFSRFDDLALEHGLEKIKTIGDGYMVASGVPRARSDHAAAACDFGLALVRSTAEFGKEHALNWELRIGIHSGGVVAGVIGKRKFAYDLWGDAVNVASRLESTAPPGKIHLSVDTVALLPPRYVVVPRGRIELRNRGEIQTCYLDGYAATES